ncbi:MAG: PAS domain S-box protein [Dehalococcoidales bacterium]|nr:PAS domain S-box protein [Dehalococcoidales bacterium]
MKQKHVDGKLINSDVTDKKSRGERASTPDNRDRYSILDSMLEGCQITDREWRYLFVNNALCRQCGRTKEQLLNKSILEVFPGIDRTVWFRTMKICMDSRIPRVVESEFLMGNRDKGWMVFSIEPVPEGIFVLTLDITDRKTAEAELRRKNMILQIVREINQLITQTNSTRELLDATCQKFVEIQHLLRCWAIVLDDDNRVVLCSGSGTGEYLNEIKKQAYEGILPRCFQQVLENGQAGIFTSGDKIYKDCTAFESVPPGLFASVFPMRYAGRVKGILAIVAREEIEPGKEETGLIQQLADDLGFALNKFDIERKRSEAEQALAISEERFRKITEVAQDLIFRIDFKPKIKIDYVSPSIEKILGYSPEEIRDDPVWMLHAVHPKDRQLIRQFISAGENIFQGPFITHWIHKNGNPVWIESRTSIIYDDQGERSVLTGIGRDVTERIQMERALMQSESFALSLQSNSPNPIIVTNADTSIRYVNPAFEELVGYMEIEVIGLKVPYPWWPPEYVEQYTYDHNDLQTQKDTVHKERNFIKKNGERFWVDVRVRKILENGKLKHFLSNWTDITEMKKAEEQVLFNEARLESLLKIAQYEEPDIQNLLDFTLEEAVKLTQSRTGHILSYNQESREFTMISWSKGVSEIRKLSEESTVLHIEKAGFLGDVAQKHKPVIENNFNNYSRANAANGQGDIQIVRFLTVPVIFDHKVAAVVGVANKPWDYDQSDVRQLKLLMDSAWKVVEQRRIEKERKRAAEEMERLYNMEKSHREELQEEARARGLFVDVLAHELRTPLTPILASTTMLNDIIIENGEAIQKKLIANIYNSTQTLAFRLEELLDIARYSRGTFKLYLKNTDLNIYLADVIARFKPMIDQHRQILVTDIQPQLPTALIDFSRLEQVILNLVSNACKFSPENGEIVFKAFVKNKKLVVEVRDNGIGITPEEQVRLFQPYHRVEQDRQKFPGIGLGLAVARQIVEAHGGKIGVNSQIGNGSTFVFSIPIK